MATILVVDDHPDNRDLLVTLLGYHGHTVAQARDGAEAMLIARAQHPDLVITDLVMPEMDGYELVKELRRIPDLAATRMVFCTVNYLNDEVQPIAQALGVRHILSKPVEPESLLATVEAALTEATAAVNPALSEEFHTRHLRLVSAKLADKVRELQAKEVSLRESEARFRSLTESAPIGIFSLDRSGRVTYANPRLAEICGTAEQVWTDLLPRDDRERVLAGLAAGAKTATHGRERVRIMPPVGGLRWADVQTLPVLDGGEQVSYVGTIDDVTEMLSAQAERDDLQAQLNAQVAETRFRGLLEAAPDAIVCADADGQIALVNAQTERLFGFRREALVGQPVEILIPDAIRSSHLALRDGYMTDPRPRPMGVGRELVARRRDGSTFPAEISLSTVDTDQGTLVMAAVHDISERLELQAARDRMKTLAERDRLAGQLQQSHRLESLGQLAGGVAHDFNNLLGVITSYAAFIAHEAAGNGPRNGWQAVSDDIQQIEQAASRAAGLTRQLLTFARHEVIQLRPLNLNDVVAGVEQMLVRTLGEHVELTTDLAPGICPVLADPGKIEQVLVNLAINARDAMPTGGRLTIRTASTNMDADHASHMGVPPGRYASLDVSDTGEGMPREVIDHAFDPFFTTKPKGAGTGLGLATVYGIIAQARGSVRITSDPGIGTNVAIVLPVTSQGAPQLPPSQKAPRGGQGETVLLVEDEAALREVTRRILTRNGYQVITAVNGRDAIEVATAHPGGIDILLTDVVMPQMSGKEAAEQIQALRPGVKVLFMSGYAAGVLSSEEAPEAAVNLLEKPFTQSSLLTKLHEVMSAPR